MFDKLAPKLTKGIIKTTKVHLTDGDADEYIMLHNFISAHGLDANHFLCLWHGFLQLFKRSVWPGKLEGNMLIAFEWIHSWLFDLETVPKLCCSQDLFFQWLDTPSVKTPIGTVHCDKLWDFVHKSIIPNLSLMALVYCLFEESLDECTTSISEGMNSSTKHGTSKVAPNMAMATSGRRMVTQTLIREQKCKALNDQQARRERLWLSDESLKELTNYMANIAARFVDSSKNLVGVQISKTEWLVYNPTKVSNFLYRGYETL
jgi:hypothetical protein